MKKYRCILWDLDGTLTLSHPGIYNCMRYALEKLGKPAPLEKQLRLCVGPPLDWSFETLFGLSKEDAQKGVALYRERYEVAGWAENDPVAGALECLKRLKEAGYDPANQLCTDDFAGHLAHNCNLSVKAAMGIAAFAKMLKDTGNAAEAEKYMAKAAEFAKLWEKGASSGDHTRLAFDQEDTWSIKYNMVWDNLLDLHIYSDEVKKNELAYYKKMINKYGLPLDSRSDYTKSDWQLWSVMLDETDEEYFNLIVDRMWDFLNETIDRVPFTDWYFTSKALHRGFQNRTVQGGLFIKLLKF